MHSFPFWTRVACVLAERSRSAPQALGYLNHDGCCCPLSAPFLELPHRVAIPCPPRTVDPSGSQFGIPVIVVSVSASGFIHSGFFLPLPPLVKFGYVLRSQGSVAAYNIEHTLHCRFRLLVAYNFDNPSPLNPVFASQGSAMLPNLQATSRQRRSQTQQSASTPAAAPAAAQAPAALTVSASGLPPLTADEAKWYIIAPELIDATDRKMMTLIL
eukprot:5083419-Pleurochrysis_carterae.AAC.10